MTRAAFVAWLIAVALAGLSATAVAQPLDMSSGGPITVTARDGIDWQQGAKVVIARGDARAVRDNVTVTADRLIAHYRQKAGTAPVAPVKPASPPATGSRGPDASGPDAGGNEIFQLEAIGNVRIFTPTDVATGDHAVYDMDQAVLVMTGRDLRIIRPAEVITARDSLEYWSQLRRSVARGNASVVTADARQVKGDTLVAYSAAPADDGKSAPGTKPTAPPVAKLDAAKADDPLAASGRIEKVEAFGNVLVRTQTDTVTGDRGVYVPDTGIARIGGSVRITRGQNQLNGQEAEVDLKTGISRLTAGGGRVQGLVTPNDAKAPEAAKTLDAAKIPDAVQRPQP